MKKSMSSRFDRVADMFDSSLKPLPEKYCQLMRNRFDLNKDDRIIDLGCGSGLLTFALSRFSNNIEGIDMSKKMIEKARNRDAERKIRWICDSVENFDFGCDRYSLIISYESFHLFSETDELIKKCELGLHPNGFLCIGWCQFEWEEILKDIILDVFRSFGMEWGDWGVWECHDFPSLVKQNGSYLSPVVSEFVETQTRDHIQNIASFLVSINKTAILETNTRMDLMHELKVRFKECLSSEWVSGPTCYSIAYSRKKVP